MFAVTVVFEVHPGDMAAFLPLVRENAKASRTKEHGCHQFDVCRSGDTIFLYELYINRAAFDAHLETPHFHSFDAAAAPMIANKSVQIFEKVYR
ncbi:MAG: putative quinol monooxygenase [Pseudomonadota bacterium]